MSKYGTGIAYFSTGGLITSLSSITDGYISATANIAGSKCVSATTSAVGVVELAGDLNGTGSTSTAPVINGIQGVIISGTPSTGQVLTASSSTAAAWSNVLTGLFSANGDLTGTSTNQTVQSIKGATAPSGTGLTTGNVLQASGSSSLTYAPINLAGGSGSVTGSLPVANIANGTSGYVLQTNGSTPQWNNITGDMSITSTGATTLAKIDGYSLPAPSGSNAVLTYNSGSLTWSNQLASSGTTYNPLQVAMLKWYPAFTSAPSVSVGYNAYGVCFDGYYIWTTTSSSNKLVQIVPSTCQVLNTYSPTGINNGVGICYDGSYLWVANNTGGTVTKINPNTGVAVGSYTPTSGSGCYSVCFDGTNIWSSNFTSSNVTKFTASTGAVVGTYSAGTSPSGICFDGTNIWVANANSLTGAGSITKILASSGAVLNTYSSGFGNATLGICFDGTYIWTANYASANVSKFSPSTGTVVGTYSVGANPTDICFDGTYIWVCNNAGASVTKILASNGTIIGTYSVGGAPEFICFDGSSTWCTTFTGQTVVKL